MAALAAAAAAVLVSGCVPGYYPGGPRASLDLHTFESTQNFPQTVVLVDTMRDEVIWRVDVPLDRQLVVRFLEDHEPENVERPALMQWRVMDRGRRHGRLDNSIPVPSADRRRLDVHYRDDPEVVPEAEMAAGAG